MARSADGDVGGDRWQYDREDHTDPDRSGHDAATNEPPCLPAPRHPRIRKAFRHPRPARGLLTPMQRRQILLGLAALQATGLVAVPASAQGAAEGDDYTRAILAYLTEEEYRVVSVTRTLLGRIRILAQRDGILREIVLRPNTGLILRDYSSPMATSDNDEENTPSKPSRRGPPPGDRPPPPGDRPGPGGPPGSKPSRPRD